MNWYPPTRLSSAAWWSTALPSGLAPLPHIFLSLMPWKPRLSRSLESLAMKLSLWAYRFAITDRLVISLPSSVSFLVLHALPSLWSVTPQVSAGRIWSTSNPFWVKMPKSRTTSHLHSFIPLFLCPWNHLPHSLQSHSSLTVLLRSPLTRIVTSIPCLSVPIYFLPLICHWHFPFLLLFVPFVVLCRGLFCVLALTWACKGTLWRRDVDRYASTHMITTSSITVPSLI